MSKAIWKFSVDPMARTRMPAGAEILYVGAQGYDVCVWALVDEEEKNVDYRSIMAYGTGHIVHEPTGKYLGTAQLDSGLVFHLFDGDDI